MPRSYVDNASNRSLGRVGMPVGSMPVSRGSSGFSGSVGGSSGGYGFGNLNSGSSSRSYVDNASNRSLGRVGMPVGSMPVSRGSSGSSGSGGGSSGGYGFGNSNSGSSSRSYVDNASNRSLGREGMPVGSMPVSRGSSGSDGSSSSPKTYVDNAQNRSLGRVGLPVGSMPVSRGSSGSDGSSSSPKTYVDNAQNRKLNRVGLPHGTAVVSKSSSVQSQPPVMKVYKDNAFNRRIGRAGLPLGSMVLSSSASSKKSSGPPASQYKESSQTKHLKELLNQYYTREEEDIDVGFMDEDYAEEVSEQAVDLIKRMNQIRLQRESRQGPVSSDDLLKSYRGEVIKYDELAMGDKIGHGGFGDIYSAKWKGTLVAVKKLRVQRVSKKRLRDFTSEIKIFCALDHPNIVQFYGACCVSPNIAIVMEFMEGCLFQMLHMDEDITLTENDKVSIIRQIARGLEYLHLKNIAHCDVKSQNVLMATIDDGYIAKFTDFGLSMMRSNSETSSTANDKVRNIGTPRYSAPEVLRGELLDRPAMMGADVYSLGLVVFEVITQDEPFDALNTKQIERLVGHGDERPVFGTDIDENVEETVKECWDRNPSMRPSAKMFLDSVEKWETLYM